MSQRRCDCGNPYVEARIEVTANARFEGDRLVVVEDPFDEQLVELSCVECGRVYPHPQEHEPFVGMDWDWSGFYVNVYLVDRAFGGPEEGGWWYDCGQILQSVPCETKQEAEEKAGELRKLEKYSNEGRPEIDSVLSEGRYDVQVECLPGADYPSRRPYYE